MKRVIAGLLICIILFTGCAASTGTAVSTTTAEATVTATTVTTAATSETLTKPSTTTVVPTWRSRVPKKTTVITTKTTTTKVTTTTKATTTKQPQRETLRILSIGNSYSQDAQAYLTALAKSEGKEFRCVNLYKAGCKLQTHYENWVTDTPIYAYEVNGTAGTDYTMLVSLDTVLLSETFDVITLQQSSWQSVKASTYQPYLNILVDAIREKQPNAKIYLHQTWAYGDAHKDHSTSYTGGTMAAMWSKIRDAYEEVSENTGLPLIPSGLAMFNAQQAYNLRGWGESIQRDDSHADKAWGRYLLALVWYKTLTGDTPANTFDSFNSGYIEDAQVRKLIFDAAMDAVETYY